MAERRTRKSKSETAAPGGTGGGRQPRVRQSRRPHRFAWLYAAISGVIMVAAVIAACLIFFQVETVTAEGSEKYSGSEIIAESGIEVGQNLFFLNCSGIASDLTESLPYLKTVTITRTLPGNVKIQVTECEPVAVLVVANGYWYIDEDGKLLELRSSDSGLPNVTGLSLVSPTSGSIFSVDTAYRLKKTSLIGLLNALTDQELLDGAISIDLSDGSELVMQYTEKYTVKIPYASDFDYKIRAMNGIIEELAAQNDEEDGVIDLTLDDEWHFIPN